MSKKRAVNSKPKSKPLTYNRDLSDARKRPATAALALFTNFFFPGAGLIVYGQKKWGIIFIVITMGTLYVFWPVTMVFSTGMTANYAFRRED